MRPNCQILVLLCSLFLVSKSFGQEDSIFTCYEPIISSIGTLESNRDPKCHATANRLEDFMYGTPLSFEAREERINRQKSLARMIWKEASEISTTMQITPAEINTIADKYVKVIVKESKLYLMTTTDDYVHLTTRDIRQYSTIAYSLRAILAIQQSSLLDPQMDLKILSQEAVEQLKRIIDMATVATLKIADYQARTENEYQLSQSGFENAWNVIVHAKQEIDDGYKEVELDTIRLSEYSMLRRSIRQKLNSYQKYNELNQAVFLRNIQVYFAKVKWPEEDEESKNVVSTFQNGAVQYTVELMHFAERLAHQDSSYLINIGHMKRAVDAFLPYSVNEFEDITYFPLLPKSDQITIEAYDLDAFRDSGLHWQIVKFALEDPSFKGLIEPDPFAAELLVESIAQFGVLLWRVAGAETKNRNAERINSEDLLNAMSTIQMLTKKNNGRYGSEQQEDALLSSSPSGNSSSDSLTYFTDITKTTGIDFTHRSADWLSRNLRSYVLDESDNVARLSIPPAFGGSGVAAEDINGDGFDDILLLSGSGDRIYLNNGDKTFRDITAESGLSSIREDGTYAEPRQPIIADFDNDGHQDIFISYVDALHKIYKGDGTGHFIDMTSGAGLGGEGLVGGPCSAFDYDKDGLLDLYIGYFGNYLKGELPTLSRTNENGTSNCLFKNKGDFIFEDVTEYSATGNKGWTQAVGHTDINNDGWQDLIVGNDFGTNAYYINNGDGTFEERSKELQTDKPSYTMNVGVADLNRDQYPDLYISNIVVMEKDDKYVLPSQDTRMHFDQSSLATMRVVEANDLFISQNKKNKLHYINSQQIDRGYASTGWAWDADFFDYDNDGDEDLYCVNGMNEYSVYGTDNPYYLSPDGSSENVSYAESTKERNVFFKNEDGRLKQYSKESGLDLLHTSRSAVYTDFDRDGDLDVILSNYHGKAYIYENNAEDLATNWIKIRLTDLTDTHQRDAIGAKIMVDAGPIKGIWREVHSTDGYLSGHPKIQHIGVNDASYVDITIIWPDGEKSKFTDTKVNTEYVIRRNKGNVKIFN